MMLSSRDAAINCFYYLPRFKTSRLIHRKGSATPSVSVAENGTFETCAKLNQSYTSGARAVLIRDMEATTHTRLTVTGGLISEALFPPEKLLKSIVWDHFGCAKNDQGVI